MRDGLEGLIHISELSHQRVAHPGDVVHEGQDLKLKIISLDSERHRLGLSLKQAEIAAGPTRSALSRPSSRRWPSRPRPRVRARSGVSAGHARNAVYSMSDAVQEPEGGIDNTLASAFAQVRQQMAAAEVRELKETVASDEAAEEDDAANAIAAIVETVAEDEAVLEAAAAEEIDRIEDAAAANEDNEAPAALAESDVVETVATLEAAEKTAAKDQIDEILSEVATDEIAEETAEAESDQRDRRRNHGGEHAGLSPAVLRSSARRSRTDGPFGFRGHVSSPFGSVATRLQHRPRRRSPTGNIRRRFHVEPPERGVACSTEHAGRR